MSGSKIIALLAFLGGTASIHYFTSSRETHTVFEPPVKQIEPASPCPWRDAETDMTNWFPGATHYETHDIILSGQRTQLRAQLGRELRPEEMALHTYPVLSYDRHLGTVMTRRVKGPHGAIELALAVDSHRKLKSLKIQRIREPEPVLNDLAEYDLERRFLGLSATNNFSSVVPAGRRPSSAQQLVNAIAAEVQASLLLFEAGSSEVGLSGHR